MESTQTPAMDKCINEFGLSISWILFSNKWKEWSSDICYKMDKHWKHYAKWKANHKKYNIIWFYLKEMSRVGKSVVIEFR